MAGKQLLISKLLMNPSGTSIIDQHVRESINKVNRLLSLLSLNRVTAFQLCSFQLDFKGHAVAIMKLPD